MSQKSKKKNKIKHAFKRIATEKFLNNRWWLKKHFWITHKNIYHLSTPPYVDINTIFFLRISFITDIIISIKFGSNINVFAFPFLHFKCCINWKHYNFNSDFLSKYIVHNVVILQKLFFFCFFSGLTIFSYYKGHFCISDA